MNNNRNQLYNLVRPSVSHLFSSSWWSSYNRGESTNQIKAKSNGCRGNNTPRGMIHNNVNEPANNTLPKTTAATTDYDTITTIDHWFHLFQDNAAVSITN